MDTAEKLTQIQGSSFPKAKDICFASEANELYFGVVGHVGSGTGFIARKLKDILSGPSRGYEVEVISASKAIRKWSEKNGKTDIPSDDGVDSIIKTERLQTLGDDMRDSTDDYAAVAQGIIDLIRIKRGEWTHTSVVNNKPVEPDKKPRAYIINSIRHPAEVNLLRLLYGDAFSLIGVVCHEEVREQRLLDKYFKRERRREPGSIGQVRDLMRRDADDKSKKYGQHVADAFWESDFFFDNTADEGSGEEFTANEDLGRFVDIITHSRIVRPTMAETGMHIAVSAQIRSSCLSRQVGAAIVDSEGNVVAIGTNEVPKAGGGVYGESFYENVEADRRCFVCSSPHCSSNAEQNDLIGKLIEALPAIKQEGQESEIIKKMRKVGLGAILEFTRVIHAEMDAISTAARRGNSVQGARMFVTTFPCHYCARHIVAAGIDEVQYIEPYPKSRALSLHGDSITGRSVDWVAPSAANLSAEKQEAPDSLKEPLDPTHKMVGHQNFGTDTNKGKVLFRPFTGVAPRLYQRAFTKDRKLKNDLTGEIDVGKPDWGGKWGIRMVPYTMLEAMLTAEEQDVRS